MAEHGGDRKSKKLQVDNIKLKEVGGTSASYLTARIARDCPAVLEEMKAGKYPSVRAAAKAAGVLKETTGLDLLKRAWAKTSPEEWLQYPRKQACRGGWRRESDTPTCGDTLSITQSSETFSD